MLPPWWWHLNRYRGLEMAYQGEQGWRWGWRNEIIVILETKQVRGPLLIERQVEEAAAAASSSCEVIICLQKMLLMVVQIMIMGRRVIVLHRHTPVVNLRERRSLALSLFFFSLKNLVPKSLLRCENRIRIQYGGRERESGGERFSKVWKDLRWEILENSFSSCFLGGFPSSNSSNPS